MPPPAMRRSARWWTASAAHFLTAEGSPRRAGGHSPLQRPSATIPHRRRRSGTGAAVVQIAPHIENVVFAFSRDLNVVLARGIRRMFAIALTQYRQALEERSVLDFSDVLQRALDLLRQMDEFSQSRFRLESRYHHVLVDEFQDTSRAQWELVSLLIQSWGEGLGLATRPSIFIVGDRKQSIYRFRDADVAVLREAGRYIEALQAGREPASVDQPQLPRAAGAAGVHQRAVLGDVAVRGAAGRFHLHGLGSVSGRDCRLAPALHAMVASAVRCSAWRSPKIPSRARRPWRRRSSASCARRRSAIGRRAFPVRRGPETSRSSFDRAPAIASSSTSSRCAAFRPTSTRASGFSTPTRSRTSRR